MKRGPYKRYTPEQLAEILALLNEGRAVKDIAVRFGAPIRTIQHIAKQKGLQRPSGRQKSPPDPAAVQKLYVEDRLPIHEVSKRLGRGYGSVTESLRQSGITVRQPGEYLRQFTTEQEDRIVSRYQSGATLAELALEYKVFKSTISGVLERKNVARRTVSESRKLRGAASRGYVAGGN